MTCVVALKHEGVVYIGADSLATMGEAKSAIIEKKVFKDINCNELLIGYSGWLNIGLMKYESLVDESDITENRINREYIFTTLLNKIRENASKLNIVSEVESIKYLQGSLLVAYADQLYSIDNTFDIQEINDFVAIGSGRPYAMGSLYSTEKMKMMDPSERIILALESAEVFDTGVGGPFYVLNTKTNEMVEF